MLKITRKVNKDYIVEGKKEAYSINSDILMEKRGVFVSLHKYGKLRGCIGQIETNKLPLWQAVQEMAIAAATEDFRFESVGENEFNILEIEISLLSALKKIKSWKDIELGKHGVILGHGRKGGVFLPQVAYDTGWNLVEFLEHLCQDKAGLAKDAYLEAETTIEVFTVESFKS